MNAKSRKRYANTEGTPFIWRGGAVETRYRSTYGETYGEDIVRAFMKIGGYMHAEGCRFKSGQPRTYTKPPMGGFVFNTYRVS